MKDDEEILIILKGNCVVKKNSMKVSNTYKDKFGHLRIREQPVIWYTEAYKEWAKTAMITLYERKSQLGIRNPLDGQYNIRCVFYYDRLPSNIDIPNVLNSITDCLIGKSGLAYKNVEQSLYQVIKDDSCKYMASFDGTRVTIDYKNPRTEITITNYRG